MTEDKTQVEKKEKFKNKLNDLSGKEWIKFTKTWFIHKPKIRDKKKIVHPASFPESLAEEFIRFFTKRGQWVLDPFLGTGSTLIACRNLSRNGIGIEINKKYAQIAEQRVNQNPELNKFLEGMETTKQIVIHADSRNLKNLLKKRGIKTVDFCFTSPPYWNQLKRNYIRQRVRKENNLDTIYSIDNPNDLGNIDDYHKFIVEQKKIFDLVYDVMKDGGYLVIITNNIFFNGRVYPLAFDTAISLSDPEKGGQWILKDEKIWCQDDKALLPLGIYSAWVGNRHHQYCLIFRKDKK